MKSKTQLPGFLIDVGINGIGYGSNLETGIGTITQFEKILLQAGDRPFVNVRNQRNNSSRVLRPVMNYSCQGMLCSCSGDKDCNDMFTFGRCGDIARCDERGCWCLRF